MDKENNTKQPLKVCILDRIEDEQVCPRSRLFFHSRECFVWFFWLISILIGSFAIAVTEFVVGRHQYTFYEATHESLLIFLLDITPYLWVMMFGVMTVVAVYNLRHTKHGYRWPVWMILASSVVLSFFGGTLLHLLGFGHEIDEQIARHAPMMYTSQNQREMQWWQAPNEGRLVGAQAYTTVQPTSTIVFKDIDGGHWVIAVSELTDSERELLSSKQTVRLMGMSRAGSVRAFLACGAFSIHTNDPMTTAEKAKERQLMIDRLRTHYRLERERQSLLQSTSFASTSLSVATECSDMQVLDRLPR